MKKALLNLSVIGSLLAATVSAQDHHFSQYDAAGTVLNPALTGMFGAETHDFSAGLQHRDQWRGLASKPFTRSAAWFEANTKDRYGYGAYVILDKAGSSGYGTLNFMLSGAYDIISDEHRDEHQLTAGLQLGLIQRSFDPGGYTFDNQYTGSAQIFDSSLPSGENFVRSSLVGFDANIGVAYVNMDHEWRVRPLGGFTLAHITRPGQSFTDQEDRTPMRASLHAGAEIDAADKLTLTPGVLFMAQAGVTQVNANLLGAYELGDSDYDLLLGAGYRTNDAVIIQTGIRYRTTLMRISYDRNVSGLKHYTGGMGGFEISLVHGGMFKGKQPPK